MRCKHLFVINKFKWFYLHDYLGDATLVWKQDLFRDKSGTSTTHIGHRKF